MGIDAPAMEFLALAKANDVDFGSTLTLGRQSRFGRPAHLVDAARPFGVLEDPDALVVDLVAAGGWADPAFTALGARTVEALDLSAFEGATVLHDLNRPLSDDLEGRWSCVVDGGVTEHVFRFPTALESSMRLVAPGGHLITMVPTNQQSGHGFYQVGPEIYFRALVPENGFELRGVFLHEETPRGRWFRLQDPAVVGHRVTIATTAPAMLYVLARRTGPAGIFTEPQQSDYAAAWVDASVPVAARASSAGSVRERVFRLLGRRAGRAVQHARLLARTARGAGLDRVELSQVRLADGPSPVG